MRKGWRLCVWLFDRRWLDIEQSSAQVQLHLPVAIGKKSVMSNAVETVWQSVKQETANELIGIERHHLLLAAVAIVPPSECDTIAIDTNEAGIGDCDTVCVTSEIGQNLFGSRKWRLCIYDPVNAPCVFYRSIECGRISQACNIAEEPKLTLMVGLLEFFQKQSSEQP